MDPRSTAVALHLHLVTRMAFEAQGTEFLLRNISKRTIKGMRMEFKRLRVANLNKGTGEALPFVSPFPLTGWMCWPEARPVIGMRTTGTDHPFS
jgi:hypothetical protein